MRPSGSHKLKSDSSEKTAWCQSACKDLKSPLQTQTPMVCLEGDSVKRDLARNPRSMRRRRIVEADISTPVAVDQRATNCLEEAVQSFTTMRS
ncbi:hypothetical protein TNCV_4590971 [Trichonephila clavipes]|nr:hypothetical protein TNCV_4590971 [Trichonephila clavipes]